MIPGFRSMLSAESPESIQRAGPGGKRISAAQWKWWKKNCVSAARWHPLNAGRTSFPRCAWRGPIGIGKSSRQPLTARSCGPRAAIRDSVTIPCFCRTAIPGHLARWEARKNTPYRRTAKVCPIVPVPFSSWRRPALEDADRIDSALFGVYIHWPFCLSKCPYCDFNSHVRHGGIDESCFVRAFASEIAATAARVSDRTVSTIFFGGGTPSLMQPATVEAILDAIARHWPIASDVEVTLEANPTSVEATRFRGFRSAGINRVSLGVQALDDGALRELGRLHSAREALDAVAVARSIFNRYSFDLIYARPGQTPEIWAAELKRAAVEAGEHLSLYQLTIEQDTPFATLHAAGKLVVPDDDAARALYDTTQAVCASAGLPAYEISNHARPGAECRHNLVYWRAQEYAGIGAGATPRRPRSGRRVG